MCGPPTLFEERSVTLRKTPSSHRGSTGLLPNSPAPPLPLDPRAPTRTYSQDGAHQDGLPRRVRTLPPPSRPELSTVGSQSSGVGVSRGCPEVVTVNFVSFLSRTTLDVHGVPHSDTRSERTWVLASEESPFTVVEKRLELQRIV